MDSLVFITGATGGLGKAMAAECASRGWDLFLTDLREGAWQTNSRLPTNLAPGSHRVRVRTVRSPWSNVEEFELSPGES